MRRLTAALLLVCLLLVCLLLGGCAAQEAAPAPSPAAEATASPLPTAPAHPYAPLRVYFDGLLTGRGYVHSGAAFLAPETVCAFYGLACETALDAEGFTLSLPALTVRGKKGEAVFAADGRYLYAPEGWIEADGKLYLPADAIARIFGVGVITHLLMREEDYYSRTTQADDLFWLIHIIYAEAHHETLAGQIGVGSVVLNRVKSADFPDTIAAVVLDREHTLQFSPVGSGEVAAQPDETAELAAFLCLEGYNTVGDSLYFVNPERGDASWFDRSLTRVCAIGSHTFYK